MPLGGRCAPASACAPRRPSPPPPRLHEVPSIPGPTKKVARLRNASRLHEVVRISNFRTTQRRPSMSTAFDPIEVGNQKLTNRIVMSPMTRSRAYGPENSVTDDTATYYRQRAEAGLIVTEGIQPSVVGQGYPHRSEEHTSELQSREKLVCRLLR